MKPLCGLTFIFLGISYDLIIVKGKVKLIDFYLHLIWNS